MSRKPVYKMRVRVTHDGQDLPKDSVCPEQFVKEMKAKGLVYEAGEETKPGPAKTTGDLDGDGDVDGDDAAIADGRKPQSEDGDDAGDDDLTDDEDGDESEGEETEGDDGDEPAETEGQPAEGEAPKTPAKKKKKKKARR